ncbi:MAG TPA: hypothetical protein VM243_00510 [Phycisphaerae bacterium]|nr:hypothetical protein [Phycisphaerae bacterium]
MSTNFDSVCDDFYVSSRLFLKLDMSLERDTVLSFFDRIRRELPTLTKFRRRDDGCLVLEEEDAGQGASRRWIRLAPGSLRFGHFGPPDTTTVRRMAEVILEHAPYYLTFSELDFDHLEVVYGFDLEYRGNHDQMVAETFYAEHPLAAFLQADEARHTIDAQPYLGIALTEDCDLQAYVEIKSRTSIFEVRTGDYESEPISVYLTVRRYWGLSGGGALLAVQRMLFDTADELAATRVVPTFVVPLADAIASRS